MFINEFFGATLQLSSFITSLFISRPALAQPFKIKVNNGLDDLKIFCVFRDDGGSDLASLCTAIMRCLSTLFKQDSLPTSFALSFQL